MTDSKVLSPKQFGDQLAKMVRDLEPMPREKAIQALTGYWKRLCQFDFDLTYGELVCRKGDFLNRLFHISPEAKGENILTKPQWTQWRKQNAANESEETLRNWKKVADRFKTPQSRKIGLREMYDTIRAEAAAIRARAKKKTPKPPVREKSDKPVPIASFPACWTVVTDQIAGMVKVAIAPDRFVDTKDKLGILQVQDANIKTVRKMLDELEKEIAKTMKALEKEIANPKSKPNAKPKHEPKKTLALVVG